MSELYVAGLVFAALSLLAAAAALAVFLVRVGAAPSTSSRLLWIVMQLILSDGCVALCVLLWHFLQSGEQDSSLLHARCRVFLPFPIFFFLAGYGWTIMVAWRFQQVSERIKLYEPPFFAVWGSAFLLVLPVIVLNALGGDLEVSSVISTNYSDGSNSYCVFNSHTAAGLWTNNICFQLPLLVTIAVNVHAFIRGIQALRNSPQSVVAREMNRAGKYLFVLLLVWVPNFMANLVQEARGGFSAEGDDDADDEKLDNDVGYFVEVMVMMSSMQGLLNVAVYAVGHKTFKNYMHDVLSTWRQSSTNSNSPLLSDDYGPQDSIPPLPTDTLEGGSGDFGSPSLSQIRRGVDGKKFNFSVRGDSESDDRVASRDKFSRLGSPEKAVRFAAD